MTLINEGLISLIKEVESNNPTPGGGSVSALIGSFGVSLARMYQNLTFNKKAFNSLDEETQKQFTLTFEELETINNKLLEAVDIDAQAYNKVIKAYKLPKESEKDKESRNKAIYDSTIFATQSPLNIMSYCLEGLQLLATIHENGNKNAISDVGVGAILLYAALEGAKLNVMINLSGFEEETKRTFQKQIKDIDMEAFDLKEKIITFVVESIV